MEKTLAALLCIALSASSLSAEVPEGRVSNAPSGTSETRYCLRVAALTGSNVETIQCWTRSEWADQDVNVDQAWARDGVSVVG